MKINNHENNDKKVTAVTIVMVLILLTSAFILSKMEVDITTDPIALTLMLQQEAGE